MHVRNFTRKEVQVSASAHQEMVSVSQARLTDLLGRKTFLSLPCPPSLPISYPQRILEGTGVRLNAPGEWPPSVQLLPESALEPGSPGGRRGRRMWGQTWLDFLWQGFFAGAFSLCSKNKTKQNTKPRVLAFYGKAPRYGLVKNTGPEIRSKVFFLALQFISVGSWVSTKPTDTQCHTSWLLLRGFAAKMRSQRERTL